MRARESLSIGLLLFSSELPTGTSFYFSQPTAVGRRPHSPADHVSCSRSSRYSLAQRPRRSSRSSNKCVAEDAAAAAATQEEIRYTRGDLERLSRTELQALCKSLNLRAVGKTPELLSRVLENHGQQESSDAETIRPASSSSVTSTDSGVVGSLKGATIDQLLSAVDDGSVSSSSSSSSASTREPTAEAVVTAAPPVDFVVEDVRPVFGELSDEQWAKVGQLGQLLTEWNSKINLISRKDIANVMKRHIIPCLALAKALNFEDGIYGEDGGRGVQEQG